MQNKKVFLVIIVSIYLIMNFILVYLNVDKSALTITNVVFSSLLFAYFNFIAFTENNKFTKIKRPLLRNNTFLMFLLTFSIIFYVITLTVWWEFFTIGLLLCISSFFFITKRAYFDLKYPNGGDESNENE